MENGRESAIGSYIRANWLGIAGICFGLIGILLSVYFYHSARKVREPSFLVDSVRTLIVSSKESANAPIMVLKRDGGEIKADVYAVRFHFWNAGREPILADQVLENIVFTLEDNQAEILDYRVLAVSRGLVGLEFARCTQPPERCLTAHFRILEHNDGFTAQVIYQGSGDALFKVSGTIQEASIDILNDRPNPYADTSLAIFSVATVVVFFLFSKIETRLKMPAALGAVLFIGILLVIMFVISIFTNPAAIPPGIRP